MRGEGSCLQGETSEKVEWRERLQKNVSVRAVNRRRWWGHTEYNGGLASSLAVSLLWAEKEGMMRIQGTLQYFPTLGTLSNLGKQS